MKGFRLILCNASLSWPLFDSQCALFMKGPRVPKTSHPIEKVCTKAFWNRVCTLFPGFPVRRARGKQNEFEQFVLQQICFFLGGGVAFWVVVLPLNFESQRSERQDLCIVLVDKPPGSRPFPQVHEVCLRAGLYLYHSFRNHYILNSKTTKLCNCNCSKLLKAPEGNCFL